MKKKKSAESAKGTASKLAKALAVGAGSGVIVWTALLFAAAWALARTAEPENFIMPAVFILAAVSSLAAAVIASKLYGMRSMLPGIVTGALLLFAVWAISLACAGGTGEVSLVLKLLLCVDFLIFSLIGAKIGMPALKSKKHVRR